MPIAFFMTQMWLINNQVVLSLKDNNYEFVRAQLINSSNFLQLNHTLGNKPASLLSFEDAILQSKDNIPHTEFKIHLAPGKKVVPVGGKQYYRGLWMYLLTLAAVEASDNFSGVFFP